MFKYYIFVITNFFQFFLLAKCHSDLPNSQFVIPQTGLEGKIVEGRYIGSNGCFSVEIPKFATPKYIEDQYHDKLGGVAFYNNDGYFLKIEIDEILPEVTSIISKHPHIKDEVLDALVHEVVIPQIKAEVPGLKILHQSCISLENGEPALYIVLNLPGEATVAPRSDSSYYNVDSKRGYLFAFSHNTQLVNFCMQDPYSLMPRFADSANIHLNERLLSHLLEIQRTYH